MTNPIDIDALRQLMEKATAGPWKEGNCDFYADGSDGDDLVIGCVGQAGGVRSHEYSVVRGRRSKMLDNNRLIVAAVNALPFLLTELEALRASRGRMVEALGEIAGKNDLSGVSDDDVEAAARNVLHECELIARAALQPAEDCGEVTHG